MLLISANPANPKKFTGRKPKSSTGRKAPKKGASAMAKKRRSAAQQAATRKLVAMNKRRKTHKNPSTRKATSRRRYSHAAPAKRRRTHRNPSMFRGGILGEIISKEGLLMVGAAFAAPMVTDYLQEKIMPSATGYTKLAVKAGLVLAGAWAIDKFIKNRKAALAYGVTGAAVVASDAVQIARGVMAGLSASEADMVANNPALVAQIAQGMGGPYTPGLSESSAAFNTAFNPAF